MAANVLILKRNPLNALLLLFIIINTVPSTNGILGSSCVSPSGGSGICTLLENCQFLMTHARQYLTSKNSIDIVMESGCGIDNGISYWCCPKTAQEIPSFIPNSTACGYHSENRIFQGETTKLSNFPWMALLKYKNDKNDELTLCAGAIINKRYILTAAHCVTFNNIRLVGVVLGEYDTKTDRNCDEEGCTIRKTYGIESYTIHGQYNSSNPSHLNDIALIRLSTVIDYTYYIQPICLPIINPLLKTTDFIGKTVTVAGWGETESQTQSNIKMKVDITVKSNIQCNKDFRGKNIILNAKQMCAGGSKGTCRGDSGGPIFKLEMNRESVVNWYVIGIVSIGPFPCDSNSGLPGVYTRVTQFNDWIVANMRE